MSNNHNDNNTSSIINATTNIEYDTAISGSITYTDNTSTQSTTQKINIPLTQQDNHKTNNIQLTDNNSQQPLGQQSQFTTLINCINQCKDYTNTYLTQLLSQHRTTDSNKQNKHKTDDSDTEQ